MGAGCRLGKEHTARGLSGNGPGAVKRNELVRGSWVGLALELAYDLLELPEAL